jgi:hypothetical protein
MRMTWRSLLFAHWPVAEEALRPIVPADLEIDTFDGRAWVGLIPFTMRGVRATFLPPVPGAWNFHECNVRTYVRRGESSGVWFFSLDAASRLAVWVARRLWRLNYHAADMELRRDGDVVHYSVERRAAPPGRTRPRLRCAWRIGETLPRSVPGELAHFLTERYALFTTDRRGRCRCGPIWHRPWSLRRAELLALEEELVQAARIRLPAGPPLLHAADPLEVEAWLPGRIQESG